jgi:AcrR family transcriptional regulator
LKARRLSSTRVLTLTAGPAPSAPVKPRASRLTEVRPQPHGGTQRKARPVAPKKRDQEVIDAAAEVFHRRGYARASMQDVADAVGILKGSLYYYVSSKDELLYRVLLEVHDAVQVILAEVSAMRGRAPLERLAAYVCRQVEYNTHNLTKIAVCQHEYQALSTGRRAEIRLQRDGYELFVERLISEGQLRGDIAATLDAALLASCVIGTVNSVYPWYRPGGAVSPDQLADVLARFACAGVGMS